MTSSTSAAATPARSNAARIAAAPSSCAGILAKAPLNEPTAVRAALAITTAPVPADTVISSSLETLARDKDQIAQLGKFGESSRSEEHTSELQSRENLVCRLLLEKKKKKNNTTYQ